MWCRMDRWSFWCLVRRKSIQSNFDEDMREKTIFTFSFPVTLTFDLLILWITSLFNNVRITKAVSIWSVKILQVTKKICDLTLDLSSSRIQMAALGHTSTPFCFVVRQFLGFFPGQGHLSEVSFDDIYPVFPWKSVRDSKSRWTYHSE